MIFGLHGGMCRRARRQETTQLALKKHQETEFLRVVLLCAVTRIVTVIETLHVPSTRQILQRAILDSVA